MLIGAAHRRYDELLGKHRLAFADHGAEFFTGPGADPARALDNLANRETGRAYAIAIEAADAAGDTASLCALARDADALDSRHVGLASLLEEIAPRCDGLLPPPPARR